MKFKFDQPVITFFTLIFGGILNPAGGSGEVLLCVIVSPSCPHRFFFKRSILIIPQCDLIYTFYHPVARDDKTEGVEATAKVTGKSPWCFLS